ncbi:MAG: hypothetical protein WC582_03745 [Patescibacteria group bacterium]|jgi:hypothetical protein
MANRKKEAVEQVINLLEEQRDCAINNIIPISEKLGLLISLPITQNVLFQYHPIIWTKKWCFLFKIIILKARINTLNAERDRLEVLIDIIKKEAENNIYNTAVALLRAHLVPFSSFDDFPIIGSVDVIKILELIDAMEEDVQPVSA